MYVPYAEGENRMKVNLGGVDYSVVVESGDIACVVTPEDEDGCVTAIVQRDEKNTYGIALMNSGLSGEVLRGAGAVASIVGQLLINEPFSVHTGMFFHVGTVIEMASIVNAVKSKFGSGVKFNNIPDKFPCVVLYTVSFYPVAGPTCEFSWAPDENIAELIGG